MTKHERRKVLTFSLLAIVGFFVFGVLANVTIGRYQDNTLKTVAAVVDPDHHPDKMADVYLVDLHGSSMRARDLRSHTVSGHTAQPGEYDTIHPNGKAERVYFHRYGTQLYALTQPRRTVFNVAPAIMWLAIAIYWGGFAGLMLWRRHRMDALDDEIDALTRVLDQTTAGVASQALLLTPHSRLYPLALAAGRTRKTLVATRQQAHVRRDRFQQLMANLPQGIMLIDAGRAVTMHNPALAEILGAPVANGPHPYVDDVKSAPLIAMIESVLRNGEPQRAEVSITATQRAVDVNVLGIEGKDGQQALVILYDLTYLRSVEQAQQDFVANVSHELKTPITAISGFAETLLAGAQDDPAARERFLKIIAKESQRLSQLVTDILTLQRGAADSRIETLNIAQVIDGIVTNLAAPIKQRRLTVDVNIPADMAVTVDRNAFLQIIRNLIDNAAFYNRDDGRITIRARRDQKHLVLTVADTGEGIDPDEQARIFERFYRVDKARSRHNGGTGLGLAIVREAALSLGGDVQVTSIPGQGSEFRVVIPVTFT